MTCSQEALSQMSTTNVVEVWQPEDADPFVPLQVIVTSILCLYQQTPILCVCQICTKLVRSQSHDHVCGWVYCVFPPFVPWQGARLVYMYIFIFSSTLEHLKFCTLAYFHWMLFIYLFTSIFYLLQCAYFLIGKKPMQGTICYVAPPYFLLYIVSIVELTQLYTSEHARNERPRVLLSGFCKHDYFAHISSSWLLNAVLLVAAQEWLLGVR